MERSDFNTPMLARLAELMAEENLTKINSMDEPVKPCRSIYARYIKRLIDIIVSAIALILTFPVNLIIAVVTLFDVGMPLIFKQVRIGKDEKPFEIIKFRNMTNETDADGILLPAAKRVTKWGKFVRKTSLDELMNFWSVFKGDMSLIGPRPLVPQYMSRYSDRHKMRLCVRPGLECPPREPLGHMWTWQEQLENDIWYVENLCFLVDCKMFIRLVQYTLDRKSASSRAGVTRGGFMGYSEQGKAISLYEVPQEFIDRVCEEFELKRKNAERVASLDSVEAERTKELHAV